MPETKDKFSFEVKGGLGEKTIDPTGQSVTWSGNYEGSIDEFRYPTLQLMSLVSENKSSANKHGIRLGEEELKAQKRELGLKIRDFFPPLDNIDTTTSSSSLSSFQQPSQDLLERLQREGVSLNIDDDDDFASQTKYDDDDDDDDDTS